MRKIFAGGVCALALTFGGPVWADDVYDACVNANEPAYSDADKQAAGCECAVEKIGDNDALKAEAIAISAMTEADRNEAASEEAASIIGACFPQEEG